MIPNFAWVCVGLAWACVGPRGYAWASRGHAWARVGMRGHLRVTHRTRFLRKFPRFWEISKFWQFFRDFQLKVGNFPRFPTPFFMLKMGNYSLKMPSIFEVTKIQKSMLWFVLIGYINFTSTFFEIFPKKITIF